MINEGEIRRRQARNSAAFWAAKGVARGHEVVRRRGFLAVAGNERAGLRVLVQEPDLTAAELDEIAGLVESATGPIDAEDPYDATDLSRFGWRSWQMPVMAREPGPVDTPAMEVVRVTGDGLRDAELLVIESFGLDRFEPYRGGELFPESFPEQDGVDVFVAMLDGEPAGAAVSVVADGYGGHYWVGTSGRFRSRGAGRAVMLGSLAHMADLPLTLTASALGRPLYESLGYVAVAPSTWWSSK